MKIRILGCHGSDQLLHENGRFLQCQPCSFLINDTVLLDAGTIGSRLTLPEQRQISHILLSHLHFDHIRGLPTLADNLVGTSANSVIVASIPEVLDGLSTHVFNGTVYPDFFQPLPGFHHSVFAPRVLKPGQEVSLAGLQVIPITVNHVVPTVGFLIGDAHATLVYSGDTYETEEIWHAASSIHNLRAAFIEVSYPNDQVALAQSAKHLTPKLMEKEFRKMRRPDLRVYAYHLKPRFRTLIQTELRHIHIPDITVLDEHSEIDL